MFSKTKQTHTHTHTNIRAELQTTLITHNASVNRQVKGLSEIKNTYKLGN